MSREEPVPANDPPVRLGPDFGLETQPAGLHPDLPHIAVLQIEPEYRPYRLGLGFVDDESPVLNVVADGHGTTHPDALLLGGGNFVADALAGDLPLELGERQKHVQHQPAHGGRGVELLGHRDERDALAFEEFSQLRKVHERTGQPVDLVDDDDVDPFLPYLFEQPLERGAFERPSREPTIVEPLRNQAPAFMRLTSDIGLAGFPLGFEGVEFLLQPLLRGLAGIDDAAQRLFLSLGHLRAAARSSGSMGSLRRLSSSPKNLGPDHWTPVMARAMADSD